MEFLARFDFDIIYIKGEINLVVDVLSRYFESDCWEESYDKSQYVNADARLDPEGEDLPWDCFKENRAMRDTRKEHHAERRPQRTRRAPRQVDESVTYISKHPLMEGIEE
jgi:hypothetical protein